MHKLFCCGLFTLCLIFATESISKPIAIGAQRSWAVGENGSVISWTSNNIADFREMNLATGIKAITAGMEHTLALDENGNIWKWNIAKQPLLR